jgi:hypothetical protein
MPPNETSKSSSPTFPQQFTFRISSAQTYGPMPSPTGPGYITPPHTRLSRTHSPDSSISISSSTHTINTDSYSGTYSVSLYKTTNTSGSSMLKTTSVFMWATRTASKAVPLSICPIPTTSSPEATAIVYSSLTFYYYSDTNNFATSVETPYRTPLSRTQLWTSLPIEKPWQRSQRQHSFS